MTKEEHNSIIESIRTAENDVDRNKFLVSLLISVVKQIMFILIRSLDIHLTEFYGVIINN